MALQDQLATALQNAHAAGDVEAARKLAQALKQTMGQAPAAPQEQDGALAYSVDRAQELLGKGVEVAGDLVGSDAVKQFGQDVVAQQQKDIEAGGYTPTYTGSLRDTYAQGGINEALGWVAEKSLENAASGGVAIGGTAAAVLTAPFSATAATVLGGGTLVASGLMGAGEAAMEQEDKTGEYDSKTAAGVGVIVGILDKFGAGKVIPKGDLANMTGQQIVEALIRTGNDDAALAIGKRILKSTGYEAATETAQEATIAGGATLEGATYDKEELIDRGLESAVLGGTMGGTTTTAIEGTKAVSKGVKNLANMSADELTQEELAARVDFSRRLERISESGSFDLKNVGKMGSKGAVDAVDNAHTEIVKDLNLAIEGLNQDPNSTLNTRKGDSEELAAKKALARLGIKNAKNKVKGVVTPDQIDAVVDLVGQTKEGQQIINLMREANELTSLHKSGYVGGLSQYTDLLSPFGSNAGYDRGAAATERLLRPLLTGGAAFQTGGTSLALQGGLAATGRIVDAVTGRRSRVAKFIKDYKSGQGQQVSATASARSKGIAAYRRKQEEIKRARELRERMRRVLQAEREAEAARKKQQAQEERDMNYQMYKDGTRQASGYNPNSPQDVLLKATGMDLKNIKIALAELIRTGPPNYAAAAKAAVRSLKYGGRIGERGSNMLSNLIKVVNTRVDSGSSRAKMVRPRDTGAVNRFGTNEAIQRGIEANKAAAQALIDRVQTDPEIDEFTKKVIIEKLEIFKEDNLSSDPLGRAKAELQDALNKLNNSGVVTEQKTAQVERYLGEYIKRIEQQQAAREKAKQEQPQPQPPQPQPPQPQPPQPEPLNPEPETPISNPEGDGNDISGNRPTDPEGDGETDTAGDPNTTSSPDTGSAQKKAENIIFQIGKEGTPYENGIDSLEAVKTLVEAIGVKFVLHSSHKSIAKAKGSKEKQGTQQNGFYSPSTNTIHVLGPTTGTNRGPVDIDWGIDRSILSAVATALHEAGHALDLGKIDWYDPKRYPVPFKAVTGSSKRKIEGGKFEKALVDLLLSVKGRKGNKDDLNHPIIKEIITLQRNGFLSVGTGAFKPTDSDRVRGLYYKYSPDQIKNQERTYFHQPVELIADALMLYMIDPKRFKMVAPETAAFLRKINNNDPDLKKVITLHSSPFAVVLGVLASLATAVLTSGEEQQEEDEPQTVLTM